MDVEQVTPTNCGKARAFESGLSKRLVNALDY